MVPCIPNSVHNVDDSSNDNQLTLAAPTSLSQILHKSSVLLMWKFKLMRLLNQSQIWTETEHSKNKWWVDSKLLKQRLHIKSICPNKALLCLINAYHCSFEIIMSQQSFKFKASFNFDKLLIPRLPSLIGLQTFSHETFTTFPGNKANQWFISSLLVLFQLKVLCILFTVQTFWVTWFGVISVIFYYVSMMMN